MDVTLTKYDSFLGRGAFGCVFKVIRDEQVFALKIVQNNSIGELQRERDALKKASDSNLTIKCDEEVIDISGKGAALLLHPVGRPLRRPKTESDVATLFGLLWQLHLKGLIHGDPRIPNVICHVEKLLWIDLRVVQDASLALCRRDVEILTRSVLRFPMPFSLDEELQDLINDYSKDITQESLGYLVTRVCQKLHFVS